MRKQTKHAILLVILNIRTRYIVRHYGKTIFMDNITTKQGNRIKQKGIWFNGATHNLENIDNIKKYIIEFPFYAYIMHSPDPEHDKPHIHFLINTRGRVSIKHIAEKLGCDYGVVQLTDREKSYSRYMLHLNNDDKEKYPISDIVSNDIDRFTSFLKDVVPSCPDLFSDFNALKNGRISRLEFVEKYKGELSHLNFYQKIRVFAEIDRIASI